MVGLLREIESPSLAIVRGAAMLRVNDDIIKSRILQVRIGCC